MVANVFACGVGGGDTGRLTCLPCRKIDGSLVVVLVRLLFTFVVLVCLTCWSWMLEGTDRS
jgi:hypothetical protein